MGQRQSYQKLEFTSPPINWQEPTPPTLAHSNTEAVCDDFVAAMGSFQKCMELGSLPYFRLLTQIYPGFDTLEITYADMATLRQVNSIGSWTGLKNIRKLSIETRSEYMQMLLDHGNLTNITHLKIQRFANDEFFDVIASSPVFDNLVHLEILSSPSEAIMMEFLTKAKFLPKLRHLNIYGFYFTPAISNYIFTTPNLFPELRHLNVNYTRLKEFGLIAQGEDKSFAKLEVLMADGCWFSNEEFINLVNCPKLSNLRFLSISDCSAITNSGLIALANSTVLGNLEELEMDQLGRVGGAEDDEEEVDGNNDGGDDQRHVSPSTTNKPPYIDPFVPFFQSQTLSKLVSISASRNVIDSETCKALNTILTRMPNLSLLTLDTNSFGLDGLVNAMVPESQLESLMEMGNNGYPSVKSIVNWIKTRSTSSSSSRTTTTTTPSLPHFPIDLKTISIKDGSICNDGIELIAHCGLFPQVESIELGDNCISIKGLMTILTSTTLPNLTHLDLSSNSIGLGSDYEEIIQLGGGGKDGWELGMRKMMMMMAVGSGHHQHQYHHHLSNSYNNDPTTTFQLTSLNLARAKITPELMSVLVTMPQLQKLKVLKFGQSFSSSDDGNKALLQIIYKSALLDLEEIHLSDSGFSTIIKRNQIERGRAEVD